MKVWAWIKKTDALHITLIKPHNNNSCTDKSCTVCKGQPEWDTNDSIRPCFNASRLFKGLRKGGAPKQYDLVAYELTAKEVK